MAEQESKSQPTRAPEERPQPAAMQPGNATSDKTAQKASVTINQSKQERLVEINQQLKSDILTVDQRAKLEDEKKAIENDAQGVTNEKKDDNIKEDDPEKKKFSEDDIIKYMYNEWLIAFFCWSGGKIEQTVGNAYNKLERNMIDKGNKYLANIKQGKATNAYNVYNKIKELKAQNNKNIAERHRKQKEQTHQLSRILGEGRLNDPNAKIGNRSALEMLAETHGVNNEQLQQYQQYQTQDGRIDTNKIENPRHKAMFEIINAQNQLTSSENKLYGTLGITREDLKKDRQCKQKAMKKLQNSSNPKDKEVFELAKQQHKDLVNAQKDMCKLGARFAQHEGRKNYFNSLIDQTALNMAEARILDKVARDGAAFNGKDIAETFKSDFIQQHTSLSKATIKEQNKYITGTNVKPESSSFIMSPLNLNTPGTIQRYYDMSWQASHNAAHTITRFKIAEMGKEPPANKTLTNLEKMVDNQSRTQQLPEEQKLQTAKREAEEEKARRDNEIKNPQQEDVSRRQQSMCDEAVNNQTTDGQLKDKQESLKDKENDLAARETQHSQRGGLLASRINQIKNNKQQEAVAEGRKNGFRGWQYDARSGYEM